MKRKKQRKKKANSHNQKDEYARKHKDGVVTDAICEYF